MCLPVSPQAWWVKGHDSVSLPGLLVTSSSVQIHSPGFPGGLESAVLVPFSGWNSKVEEIFLAYLVARGRMHPGKASPALEPSAYFLASGRPGWHAHSLHVDKRLSPGLWGFGPLPVASRCPGWSQQRHQLTFLPAVL